MEKKDNRHSKQAKSKGVKRPPLIFKGKNAYLQFVGAIDCIKDYNEWKTSFGLIQELKESETEGKNKTKQNKPLKPQTIAKTIDKNKFKGQSVKSDSLSQMSKLERKSYYNKCKRTLRKTWDLVTESESDEGTEQINVPDNFRTYTIQDRTIAL